MPTSILRSFFFRLVSLATVVPFLLLAPLMGGCQAIGALAASYEATGSHEVEPKYDGLDQKSFAVVVRASQLIQADFPEVVIKVSIDAAERLKANVNASGYVPGDRVVDYLYNHPRWVARPLDEVAKALGVDRVIYVEINEYRLQDMGNSYLWDGVASAMVGVIEADSATPEEFAYRTQVRVTFPDSKNAGASDLPRAAVNTELARRLIDRVTWLFYTHEELNRAKY